MKSPVVKRSIVIAGHKTSVSLEEPFWRGLKDIAATRRVSLSDLVGSIDTERQHGNLSSAMRLFVLSHYQTRTPLPDRSFTATDQHHAALTPRTAADASGAGRVGASDGYSSASSSNALRSVASP